MKISFESVPEKTIRSSFSREIFVVKSFTALSCYCDNLVMKDYTVSNPHLDEKILLAYKTVLSIWLNFKYFLL